MDTLPGGSRNRNLACDLDAKHIRNPGILDSVPACNDKFRAEQYKEKIVA